MHDQTDWNEIEDMAREGISGEKNYKQYFQKRL